MTHKTLAGRVAAPWIEWSGGACPVAVETRVIVRFRYRHHGHHSESKVIRPASAYIWHWSEMDAHKGGDIVQYRIVEPTR